MLDALHKNIAKEHSEKVEPKPSGLVLFFQMPRGLAPQSYPKDGSSQIFTSHTKIWCGAKSKATQVGKSCIISLKLHSGEVGANRRLMQIKNCDLNALGPNQHIWLLCSSHPLCCLYEGFLISAMTCTDCWYGLPRFDCEDAKLNKKKHEHIRVCTSAVGPRCYHHCRQCGCTASTKGIRSRDNTFWTSCSKERMSSLKMQMLKLSIYAGSLSGAFKKVDSVQSCPEVLMSQAKIRWFTALLRCALGSQNVMTSMLPISPISLISDHVIQIDSRYFHSKTFYCSASRMLPSMPVPFFTCHRKIMSQWHHDTFHVCKVALDIKVTWREIRRNINMDLLALTSELLQTSAVHKRG